MWPSEGKTRVTIAILLLAIGGAVMTGLSSWGFLKALGELGSPGFVLFTLGTLKISVALIIGLFQWYWAYLVYTMKGL